MPKGADGEKRPADAIDLAVLVGRIATGEVDDEVGKDVKNKAAKALSRKGANARKFDYAGEVRGNHTERPSKALGTQAVTTLAMTVGICDITWGRIGVAAMPDSIIEEAIAKRDAAAAEMRRWDDFITMYREITGGYSQHRVSGAAARLASPREPYANTGALAETESAAVEAIRAVGRPIPTREMLEALRARGVEVGGKDPASTLSARLSRSRLLENVRPYGWRIKELADDEVPSGSASPANVQPQSGPVEPGQEVAHEVGGVFK